MIGRLDDWHDSSNYVYLIGSNMLSNDLHNLSEDINKKYTQLDLDYRFNKEDDPNRYYYRSDHYNFAKNNIPVIFYFNGIHEDYHKETDTVEKIDYSKIEKIARLIFLTAWEIVNKDERIKLN
jgi:Zn-dependent M28 family amino/carboxypeptidase